jgi:hypothetical protein
MCTCTGGTHSASRTKGGCAHPPLPRKDLVGLRCPCYTRQRVLIIASLRRDSVTDGAIFDKRRGCVSVGSVGRVIVDSNAANTGIVSSDQG